MLNWFLRIFGIKDEIEDWHKLWYKIDIKSRRVGSLYFTPVNFLYEPCKSSLHCAVDELLREGAITCIGPTPSLGGEYQMWVIQKNEFNTK